MGISYLTLCLYGLIFMRPWNYKRAIRDKPLEDLDREWARQGDGLAIGVYESIDYYYVFLAIRETIQITDDAGAWYSTMRGFEIRRASITSLWNTILRKRCQEFGLQYCCPEFYIINQSNPNDPYNVTNRALFLYGMQYKEEQIRDFVNEQASGIYESDNLFDCIRLLDQEWEKRGEILCIVHDGNYVDPSQIYLGIREVFYKSDYVTSFKLPRVDTRDWDLALEERCKELGIRGQALRFHLVSIMRG